MKTIFKSIASIGIVVKDLNHVVSNFTSRYGISPWSIYTYAPNNMSGMKVNMEKTKYSFKKAVCFLGETSIEIIQPLDEGSIYFDFLKTYGENLHHISYEIDKLQEKINYFNSKGIKISMSGDFLKKNKFLYLDSLSELKHIISISENEPGFFKIKNLDSGISWLEKPEPLQIYSKPKKQKILVNPLFKKINQVAFVVKNVDDSVIKFNDIYGIGPWKIWQLGPSTVQNMSMYGKKQDYKFKVGITKLGNIDFEIIQPLDEVSIYYDFLKKNGEGFHHVAYEVEDFEKVIKYIDEISVRSLISGVWQGKHTWVYLDSYKDLKHIAEINYTEKDYVFPKPLYTYP